MSTVQMPKLPVQEKRLSSSGVSEEQSLVQVPLERARRKGIPLVGAVLLLPVELDVAVPVGDFRVRNLLALECGQVIETEWGHGEDVPLFAGQVQLAWNEFEIVDSQMGVRVTRLA